jgi:hypothetical protein
VSEILAALGPSAKTCLSSNTPIMNLVGLAGRPLALNKGAISASSHLI